MSCITELLKLKGDKEFLPVDSHCVVEGGGIYNGYEYLITFTNVGSRCGYVAVPSNFASDFHINCHGGITFRDTDHAAKDLLPVRCNDVWLGFDAGHLSDKCDIEKSRYYFGDFDHDKYLMLDTLNRMQESLPGKSTHKTYEFMENQCKGIIDQLVESRYVAN